MRRRIRAKLIASALGVAAALTVVAVPAVAAESDRTPDYLGREPCANRPRCEMDIHLEKRTELHIAWRTESDDDNVVFFLGKKISRAGVTIVDQSVAPGDGNVRISQVVVPAGDYEVLVMSDPKPSEGHIEAYAFDPSGE